MADVWYTTREAVTSALESLGTARSARAVDRAIGAAGHSVRGQLHRHFFPKLATRSFDWPNRLNSTSGYRLWLNDNELISVSQIVSGGITMTSDQYDLRRSDDHDDGPYDHIEVRLSSSGNFSAGATFQQALAVTGVYGYDDNELSVGSLAAGLAGSASATASISFTTSDFGVGSMLLIDAERVIVRERRMADTNQNLGGTGLIASPADTLVPVSDGLGFAVGETILIDAERMIVNDVAGNNLVVERAVNGTVLNTHATNADIYGLTAIVVDRAQAGTTLAAHAQNAPVTRWIPPAMVEELTIAEALNRVLQEGSGYARTVGAGDMQREQSGKGIEDIRREAKTALGRQLRLRSI
jgi:hypothetical protein